MGIHLPAIKLHKKALASWTLPVLSQTSWGQDSCTRKSWAESIDGVEHVPTRAAMESGPPRRDSMASACECDAVSCAMGVLGREKVEAEK